MARRKIIKGKGPIRIKYIPPDLPKKIPAEKMARVMAQLSDEMVDVIRYDTRSGVDADLQPFAPYSPLYGRMRSAAGYGTKVDMTLSGDMLNSLVVRKTNKRSLELGFNDGLVSNLQPLVSRAWGGLSTEDRQAVWAMAAAAKRNAGKGPGVGHRKSKAVKGRAATQGPQWGGPPATNSEKARWTNKLRPWFTLGGANSARFKEMQLAAVEILADALNLKL